MFLGATATFRPRGDLGQFVASVITPAVRTSVEQSAEVLVEAAKAYCPVDTGALRDSITSKITETAKTIVATVDAGMPYAGYVEFGTGIRGSETGNGPFPYNPSWPGMVAQPFMRPAMDDTRETIRDYFASNIAVALRAG